MEQYLTLTKRNLRLFLRDRSAVFFSLFTMFIVIILMVFFLGDSTINSVVNDLKELGSRDAAGDKERAGLYVLSWTAAGIISINAVTVTLSAYAVMIKDKVTGKLNSIYTAPVKRITIAAAYITAAWIASIVICTLSFVILEFYCVNKGMDVYTLEQHLKLFGLIVLNSFLYASMMYVFAMLSKTEGAWSGFGTVVGTIVGFLGGIYIPVGAFSGTIEVIMKSTPVLYGTGAFRAIMTSGTCEKLFAGLPASGAEEMNEVLGVSLFWGNHEVSMLEEVAILAVVGIIFLIIGTVLLKYTKKSDR